MNSMNEEEQAGEVVNGNECISRKKKKEERKPD